VLIYLYGAPSLTLVQQSGENYYNILRMRVARQFLEMGIPQRGILRYYWGVCSTYI
jgi:hypothetical protein